MIKLHQDHNEKHYRVFTATALWAPLSNPIVPLRTEYTPEPETINPRHDIKDIKPDFLDLLNESMESFSLLIGDTSTNSHVVETTSGDDESIDESISNKQ